MDAYSALPIVSKSVIKKSKQAYFTDIHNDSLVAEFTSGSTGEPFVCYKTARERNVYSLRLWRERRRLDRHVSPSNFMELFDSATRKFGVNFVDLAEENLHKIFTVISNNQPRWLCLSPSMAFYYAKFHMLHKYRLDSLRFIELQGEYIDFLQRKMIEEAFGVRTVVHYGLRECWTVAYECECNRMHIFDDFFLLDASYERLLLTSAINQYMPIVKYDTGDTGEILWLDECTCGRNNTYILNVSNARQAQRIQGDMFSSIIYKKVIKSTIEHFGYDDSLILGYFVTEEGGCIHMHIEPGEKYSDEVEKVIVNNMRMYFRECFRISVDYGVKPVLSRSGKQSELIML